MEQPLVVLIGGAPGVGKSTLGRALATRLNATSLTVDDLLLGAKALTTPGTHPGLHVMSRLPFPEYFTSTPVDQLAADADAQHAAIWPAIEGVVRCRATWGPSIVIDGWSLLPERVATLDLPNAKALWLVAGPGVLEERERRNTAFLAASSDPERMLENFLGRSLRFNDLIERQAAALGQRVLRQDGRTSVEVLCDRALAALADR